MKYPFAKPLIGSEERAAVDAVLKQPTLVHGKKNQELEERFADRLGVKHAVAVSSATAGLAMVYSWRDPNTHLYVVPAMTHVASAHAPQSQGLKVHFMDKCVWDGTWLDKALNIDTAPEPHGVAVYSLYPSKNLTCGGDGGIIATDDSEIAETCRSLRAFGYSDRVGLHYDVDRLAGNYRLSEVHAAIAVEQLKKLDGFQYRRAENARYFCGTMAERWRLDSRTFTLEIVGDWYCINIYEENRDEVVRKLQNKGVGVSIHYPIPVPLTRYYREKYGHKPGDFPKAEETARTAISIPIGPHLNPGEMSLIAEAVCASV